MITNISKRLLIGLSFIICHFSLSEAVAADYVDDINNAANNEAGHQVIYEMNVGSFTQAGTFAAAQQRLDELKTLGVDIVWLMPIYPRGGGINSPYAPTNYQEVNPAYGSVDDLKAFVTAAHNLNMQVWLDWVPNHTATNADWVTMHPEYYGWNGQQEFHHPNNYGDVWQLNYYNTELVNAMNNALKFWIDEADIDGYRCDYISSPQIPASYWTETISLIKNYKSGKTITFLGEADIAQDVTKLKTVGFDYDYAWAYQSSLASYGSTGIYAAPLKTNADKMLTASSSVSFGRLLYVTNHDQNWNESKKTLTEKYGNNRYPLTVLAYTLYGMPLIYNGQEVGGNQALNYFTDTKINWTMKDDKMRNTIRTLTALKHAVPALDDKTAVNWVTLSPANSNVLAYTRKVGNSEILVVLNMATQASTATLTSITAGDWSLWLNSETIAQGVSRKQQNFSSTQTITLDAKGYRVYVKGTFSEEEPPAPDVYVPTLNNSDEVCIFFETANADTYAVWAWGALGGGEAYCTNTSWPGDDMMLMGQTATGSYVYKCILTKTNEIPQYLIISKNGGDAKIYDGITFVNHGYYVEGQTTPTQIISATSGIGSVYGSQNGDSRIYDLSGRQVVNNRILPNGVYIRNGKKIVIK
jgi:1,4-alpha-glucan branching enzyme